MAITIVIDGMEHTIQDQTWTGPLADRLNEFSEPFAAQLGGEVPWPDMAIAEHIVKLAKGQIIKAEQDAASDHLVY